MGTRWTITALLATVSALAVAACGGGSSGSSSSGGGSKSETIKVGAALIGPKNDKSFDQAAYEGIQAAEQQFPQLKLTSALENRATDSQRSDAVQTLAPVNKLVVTVSSSFGPVLDIMAPKFRNTYFIDISGYTQQYHPN